MCLISNIHTFYHSCDRSAQYSTIILFLHLAQLTPPFPFWLYFWHISTSCGHADAAIVRDPLSCNFMMEYFRLDILALASLSNYFTYRTSLCGWACHDQSAALLFDWSSQVVDPGHVFRAVGRFYLQPSLPWSFSGIVLVRDWKYEFLCEDWIELETLTACGLEERRVNLQFWCVTYMIQ